MSLQSLLRKSREYMEREQGRGTGSKVNCSSASKANNANCVREAPAAANESLSDKENESASPVAEAASQCQSPVTAAPITSPGQRQSQGQSQGKGQGSPTMGQRSPAESVPSGPSRTWLCQPEPSLSPRPHRGRPRPVSAGDLLFSFPSAADSGTVRPKNMGTATWLTMDQRSPDHTSGASSLAPSVASSRRASHTGSSPVAEPAGIVGCGTGAVASAGPCLPSPEGFRRRCHTLDSQYGPPIDRSQERLPRFMAGVAQRPSTRRSPPGPAYTTHGQESPVPALLRTHPVIPDPVASQVRLRLDSESDHEGRRTPSLLTTPVEDRRTGEAVGHS